MNKILIVEARFYQDIAKELLLGAENVVVGRLIPAGTGLAYHKERKRKRENELAASRADAGVSAADVEAALTAALKGA